METTENVESQKSILYDLNASKSAVIIEDNNSSAKMMDCEGIRSESDDESEQEHQSGLVPLNGNDNGVHNKRQRKKVQRLSETWNRVHESREEERAKAIKAMTATFEDADGTALVDIPLIEATIRKVKPIELKTLHSIIYGRPGTVTEVRSNLRKFRGFSFKIGSENYEKKCVYIKQRLLSDLRESLRILNLEVSGTRDHLASRLMEFLHKPSAQMVKHQGKVKKSNRGGTSKNTDDRKGKKKKSVGMKQSKPKLIAKSISSCDQSVEETSRPNYQSSLSDMDSDNDDNDHDDHDDDNENNNVSSGQPGQKRKQTPKRPKENVKVVKSTPKRARKRIVPDFGDDVADSESDEDAPLSTLTKATVPTDLQLKKNIIDLLKTVNLEATSLKLVREKIFANYPATDLTNRKEFINATVKEFLSQS